MVCGHDAALDRITGTMIRLALLDKTDFETIVERLADEDLPTFASLLDDVYVGEEDDERRVQTARLSVGVR